MAYLEGRREGLGDSFVFDLEARINQIMNNPYLAQKRYGDFRMAVTRRFGYKIFYTVDDNVIQIAAV